MDYHKVGLYCCLCGRVVLDKRILSALPTLESFRISFFSEFIILMLRLGLFCNVGSRCFL